MKPTLPKLQRRQFPEALPWNHPSLSGRSVRDGKGAPRLRIGLPILRTLLGVVVLLAITGCANRPAVASVWIRHVTGSLSASDANLFQRDRASRLESKAATMAESEQITVRWRGPDVERVTLEYRQPNAPDRINVLEIRPPANQHQHDFLIPTADQGSVSAWRVRLWKADKQMAERTSVLW